MAVEHVISELMLQALQKRLLDLVLGDEVRHGQWRLARDLIPPHAGREMDVEVLDGEFAGDEAREKPVA